MATLTAESVAQLLYQAGFRGEGLAMMVAIGKRESGYLTDAHRTDGDKQGNTGDFGLFQINYVNAPALIKAGIISNVRDLLNPIANAKAAWYLSHNGTSFSAWGITPGKGWTAGGNPLAGTNITAARQAVSNAANQGLLGKDWATSNTGWAQDPVGQPAPFNSGATGAAAAAGAAGAAGGGGGGGGGGGAYALPGVSTAHGDVAASTPPPNQLVNFPPDTQFIRNDSGAVSAVYDLGGTKLYFNITAEQWGDGHDYTQVSDEDWQNQSSQMTYGGDSAELTAVSQHFSTFGQYWDSILAQVMGPNNPAKDDPGVKAIIAQFAARPDMTPAELQNKLTATDWYQKHTQGQLEWNGLGEAEKQKRRDDAAAQMVSQWEQFNGGQISADDPRLANYLEQVASGQMTIGSWTENVAKKTAAETDGTPYSQQLKQPAIDIENTALKIRQQLTTWGLQWSEGTVQDWARNIVNKNKSDDDLMTAVKDQAKVLYAWKDYDTDTTTAAAPWTETYKRVMEKNGALTDPKIQAALTAGQQPWQFEQDLKKSQDWLSTKNARDSLTSMVGNVGKMMGFA